MAGFFGLRRRQNTSHILIEKQVAAGMMAAGYIIPGEEFHELANIVNALGGINGKFGFKNLKLGAPLFMTIEDYRNVSAALTGQFDQNTTGVKRTAHSSLRDPEQMAVVLMGHGTEHSANSAYSQMAAILAEDYDNVLLGQGRHNRPGDCFLLIDSDKAILGYQYPGGGRRDGQEPGRER